MKFLHIIKEKLFILLFFIATIAYIIASVTNDYDMIYFTKPFIVISLLIHYVFVDKGRNIIFIAALFAAYFGDLFFSIKTEFPYIIAMGCFLLYSLFIMVIVSTKMKFIEFKKLLLFSIPFLIIIFFLVFVFFNNKGSMLGLFYVNAFAVVLLGSFSLYYLVKTKQKAALFFTLGCLFFIIAGAGKGFKLFYEQVVDAKILNIAGYALSLFFYYLGVQNSEN